MDWDFGCSNFVTFRLYGRLHPQDRHRINLLDVGAGCKGLTRGALLNLDGREEILLRCEA